MPFESLGMSVAVEINNAAVSFGELAAVDGVTFAVPEGSCFGVVGESGSGKTTLMRAILGLQRLTEGAIAVFDLEKNANVRQRARIIQAIFQDPASSLSPRRSIRQSLAEVGELLGEPSDSLANRINITLRRLGLSSSVIEKYPYQLSGGQARRVALLRALLVKPRILIADEPTAGLDVSIQGDMLNLLQELRRDQNLTLIVVSHNLAVVRLVADYAAVMFRGKLVEQGRAESVFDSPSTNYMRQLLKAWPRLHAPAPIS
jgi:oligopeptide transport system ATP-binding protein